jgi:hypothetical protein
MKRFYLLSYCTPARKGKHEVEIEAKDPQSGKTGALEYEFTADGFGPSPRLRPRDEARLRSQGARRRGRWRRRRVALKAASR